MGNKLKIGVFGVSGRMGQLIAEAALQSPSSTLVGGTSRHTPLQNYKQFSPEGLVAESQVLIDFTHPDALETHLNACLNAKKPIMVGTTGLEPHHYGLLEKAAQSIPVIYAPNTSLGITLLMSLIEKAASVLGPEHDIEILETHHREKIDAPSGTALALGKVAAHARGEAMDIGPADRYIKREKRPLGGIGYASLRGGRVAGEHAVHFFGDLGQLTLSYASTSPHVYAEGALKAATWVLKQRPGLYNMRDVLGL